MKYLSRHRVLISCILLSFLLVQLTGNFTSQSASATESTVILFDQVHLQYYTSERMQSAITSLNNTENYVVLINRQRFSDASLLGVDLLVIGNPERSFTFQELSAISEYLENGGNLFLLGDPRSNPSNLNEIVDFVQYTDARFSKEVIIDEERNLNNASKQISVSREELRESSPIINDVNNVVTHTLWVEVNEPTKIIATGSNYSFAGLDGSDQPAWLVASTVGRSRLVLCGSTRMFSDLKPIDSEDTWYNSQENARLWQNIFLWFTQRETSPSFLSPITIEPLTIMIYSLIMGVSVIGGGYGVYYLFQQKERKPVSEIVREKKAQEPKEKTLPKEEAEEKKKKPPPPPKKRRRKKDKKRKYKVRR